MSEPKMQISRSYQELAKETSDQALERLNDGDDGVAIAELLSTIMAGISTLVMLGEGSLNAQALIAEQLMKMRDGG